MLLYRLGSRSDEPIEPILLQDISNVLESIPEEQIKRKQRNGNEGDCSNGVCEISLEKIFENTHWSNSNSDPITDIKKYIEKVTA